MLIQLLCATWIAGPDCGATTPVGEWLDICTDGAAPRSVNDGSIRGSSIGVGC